MTFFATHPSPAANLVNAFTSLLSDILLGRQKKSIDLFYLPESVFVCFAVVSFLLTRAINSSFIASERTTLASERIWRSENDDDGSGSGWF